MNVFSSFSSRPPVIKSVPNSSIYRNSCYSFEYAGTSRFLTWLCNVRYSMVEDTASLDLEHIRTIFTPVLKLTYYAFIFSDSWSTTMLLGAHTNIGVLICKLGQ